MSAKPKPVSISPTIDTKVVATTAPRAEPTQPTDSGPWPALPTETEIAITPDGLVVIADLPAELSNLVRALGESLSCAVAS